MKQKIINAILCLFFLAGFGITLYPAFSDWYISRHQGQVIEDYDEKAAQMSQKELKKELDKAHIYNTQLLGNVVLTDPFDADAVKEQNADYNNILNVDGDGVMGSIEIPSIKVYLPIYHGTDSTSLEKGAGHLENSSFPVGGRGTHAVISAHTGLPSAKMFDNLTEVKEGDVFYIHVLNQTLAYEVNQIKVVLPENTSDLLINRNEDYVTMVTCTPYGINSHAAGSITDNKVQLQDHAQKQMDIANIYSEIPDEYLTSGELSIKKNVIENNQTTTVDDTFYATVYKQTESSDGSTGKEKIQVVQLKQNDTVRITVPIDANESKTTFIVEETDANGNALNLDNFAYEISGEGKVEMSLQNTEGSIILTNIVKDDAAESSTEEEEDEPTTRKKKKETETVSERESKKSKSTKTGDNNPIVMWIAIGAVAALVIIFLIVKRRKSE